MLLLFCQEGISFEFDKYGIMLLVVITMEDKIRPKEVASWLKAIGASCGEHYQFPRDIDTSECGEFFGTRCPYNVHVTDKRKAHIDKFDPRYYPLEHFEEATGIPPLLTVIFGILGVLGLAASLSKTNN